MEKVRQCNNNSHFNAGDVIVADAENTFKLFYNRFGTYFDSNQKQREYDSNFREELNDEQKAYLLEREKKWKELIEAAFNEELSRRADYVPVTVAGPARYDSDKMGKKVDKLMKIRQEWDEKIRAFLENTEKGLFNLTALEVVLDQYRTGKCPEPISSDDPHVKEKLEAKIEYLKNYHEHLKEANKQARKQGKTPPFAAYELAYARADIKRYENRLKQLSTLVEKQPIKGFSFDGGYVTANYEDVRLQIFFDEKPNSEMIKKLKSKGFHWAPSIRAWQRKLNNNALYAARCILKVKQEV